MGKTTKENTQTPRSLDGLVGLDQGMAKWMKGLKERAESGKKHGSIAFAWICTPPPGFPKGELVGEYENGKTISYDCYKVIAWVDSIIPPNSGGSGLTADRLGSA